MEVAAEVEVEVAVVRKKRKVCAKLGFIYDHTYGGYLENIALRKMKISCVCYCWILNGVCVKAHG